MKILNVISHFSSGGAEIFCKELSISLNQENEVIILALSEGKDLEFQGKYESELKKYNIKYKILSKKPNKDRIKTLREIRKFVKEINPDIINTHLEYVTFHVCNATLGMNVPIVQTIHSTTVNYKLIQRYYLNLKCKKYISISNTVKNSIENIIKIKENKISVIYNGINIKKFSSGNREIKRKINKIVMVGRLSEEKNHKLFIEAYAKVVEQLKCENTEIPTVDIIGTGNLDVELKELVKDLNLEQYINFLGAKSNINELLYNYDIYVLPSKWEGLSISLLEALSTRIPVIVTDVGSNSEIITNEINGIIIKSEDKDAMVKYLKLLTNNYEIRRNFYSNLKNCMQKYDIDTSAKIYENLYSEVVAKK